MTQKKTQEIVKEVTNAILKMAKQNLTPSEIGVVLRNSYGIPQAKIITGSKISRILILKGQEAKEPEDFYSLGKKRKKVIRHLEIHRMDKDSKFHLSLIESRINRLARYYKKSGKIHPNWKLAQRS